MLLDDGSLVIVYSLHLCFFCVSGVGLWGAGVEIVGEVCLWGVVVSGVVGVGAAFCWGRR
ncbi:predicted protein [Streptomyces sp. SPB78]|nr:predicted protein [Streptomyces sp. SPB78]